MNKHFKLRVLPLMVGLALLAMNDQSVMARSNETTAAFTATQLVRQFTLKNTVAQVNQGMQSHVAEVNGQLRGEGMGATPSNYPVGMGSVPNTVNLPQRDGAGRPLGYCAWDNTSAVSTASYLAGSGVASPLVYAVISPGLNGAIETTCAEILLNRVGNGDDYVLTTAPTQASSKQFRSSVGSEAELFAMSGENGDVRLVTDTNRLYSYQNGSWSPIGGGSSTFTDDSASNGAGAISYTTGKVTVGDFEAAVATISSSLTVGGSTSLNGGLSVTGNSSISGNLAVSGSISSTAGFTGSGALLTDLNANAITSGVLGVAQGGTGVTGVPLQGQLLIGTGTGYALGGLVGTANQVTVNYSAGNLTFGLPQDMATTSTPTFGGLVLNGVITGTTANFTGRVDVGSIYVAGEQILALNKTNIDMALTYASDTNDINFNQPNLVLGAGALAGSKRAANVAIGAGVMGMLTADPDGSKGVDNTGVGYRALYSATTGYRNTAIGARASHNLTTGYSNTSVGRGAGYGITSGYENTALGENALFNAASSYQNIAIGKNAMLGSNSAYGNISIGNNSLLTNTSGYENTAIGRSAINLNTTGFRNIGVGLEALRTNATGSYNMGLGYRADVTTGALVYAQAIGNLSQVATSNTMVLGALGANKFGSTTDDQIVIGATSRNDTYANTKLYVNGVTNLNGDLRGTTATFTGAVTFTGGLTVERLNLGTLAGGVSERNMIIGFDAMPGTQSGVGANTALGVYALYSNTSGNKNTAVGNISQFANTTGYRNSSLGYGTLYSNTTGYFNTALGETAMLYNTTGHDNTAVGQASLVSNTTGSDNTAVGRASLYSNTIGLYNTTVGKDSLYSNTTGSYNAALGEAALYLNQTGEFNTAVGQSALYNNVSSRNSAFGQSALRQNTTGIDNTGIGQFSLGNNTTGTNNTAVGQSALSAITTGRYSTGLGQGANVLSGTLNYATSIGASSRVSTSNTMVLGAVSASKDSGVSTTDDQIVIGATSRNDTQAGTVLYVNGNANLNGNMFAAEGTFNGRLKIATGSSFQFGENIENLDTTTIYRFNEASDQTRLRVRLSDNSQNFGSAQGDEFQIGYENGGYMATFRVAGSGSVISSGSVTATAFNTSSDRRLKTDLQQQDADGMLNKLSGLKAYSYEYIGQSYLGRRIGVIAQDMLPLFPEAVSVRPDGFYAVDYGALGALAASGVGRLNERVNDIDKVLKDNNAAQTIARIDTLEGTVTEHAQRIGGLETWKAATDKKLVETDGRIGVLESWKTSAIEKMDSMQSAIDLNIKKIADHAVAIQANTKSIERLDDALFALDGRVKNNSDLINNINARWNRNFSASEDGSLLTVTAVELKVSNFTAQNMRANSVYAQRLEAEMARIAEMEVNNLRANSAVANTVQAEQVNTGSAQVYAGVGMPAVLFAARSDGHYTVSTSALDGSYATATVIVNAGQAKVISGAKEGIELYAEGNVVKAIAAGKSIRASWIKTG